MNTLIAVGTGAAYLYSAAATFAPGFFAGAAGVGAGSPGPHLPEAARAR